MAWPGALGIQEDKGYSAALNSPSSTKGPPVLYVEGHSQHCWGLTMQELSTETELEDCHTVSSSSVSTVRVLTWQGGLPWDSFLEDRSNAHRAGLLWLLLGSLTDTWLRAWEQRFLLLRVGQPRQLAVSLKSLWFDLKKKQSWEQ